MSFRQKVILSRASENLDICLHPTTCWAKRLSPYRRLFCYLTSSESKLCYSFDVAAKDLDARLFQVRVLKIARVPFLCLMISRPLSFNCVNDTLEASRSFLRIKTPKVFVPLQLITILVFSGWWIIHAEITARRCFCLLLLGFVVLLPHLGSEKLQFIKP